MNTLERLQCHAGLKLCTEFNVSFLADAIKKNDSFQDSVDDVLKTLQRVNLEMNGIVPSNILEHSQTFPRALVYTVQEIIRLVSPLFPEADQIKNESLNLSAWKIETAWSAILAGDIDDVVCHVNDELRTF